MNHKRPQTLLEVSLAVLSNRMEFHFAMKEFIDEFIVNPCGEAIIAEPLCLDDVVQHVYLAGVAEYLAFWIGIKKPGWVENPDRFLKESVHFGQQHSTVYIQMETPFSFRRRMLFCGDTMKKLKLLSKK